MTSRSAYVSEHLLALAEGTDPATPGAAITRELCGHWEHDGACRWPHHSSVAVVAATGPQDDDGGERELRVRTVFVCPSAEENDVRAGIAAGLRGGTHPPAPPGWSVRSSNESSELTPDEEELAARLNRS